MSKKKNVVHMSREKAEELYHNIHTYYACLRTAKNIDRTIFEKLTFGNSAMDNHLRRSVQSTNELLKEFDRHFRAKDTDIVDYELPGELYRVIDFFVRQPPQVIDQIMTLIESKYHEHVETKSNNRN